MRLEISYRIEGPTAAGTFLLKAWTSTTDGISPEVFVYAHNRDYKSYPNCPEIEFSHIASMTEMLTIPAEAHERSSYPFLRRAWVHWEFASLTILHEKVDMMKGMVKQLVRDGVCLEQQTRDVEETEGTI